MIFVYRAAIVAVAAFLSALAGSARIGRCRPPMSSNRKAWSVRSSASSRRFCRSC